MKKFSVLFVLLDFIFVGFVLTYSNQSSRTISSVSSSHLGNLSEGQKNKYNLIKSFKFQQDSQNLILQTDLLQMICETSSLIELKFTAQNISFDGVSPTISNTYSCLELKKDLSVIQLITSRIDFQKTQQENPLSLAQSQLKAVNIYATEEFPSQWRLAEVKISGSNTFTINEFEIAKVLQQNFDFDITTSAK